LSLQDQYGAAQPNGNGGGKHHHKKDHDHKRRDSNNSRRPSVSFAVVKVSDDGGDNISIEFTTRQV
jgi:hypothetical protein